MLRGAGIKIPKELRQTADPGQIVEFARDKLGKIKGGSKELKRSVATATATIAKHEATIATLAQQNASLSVYAEAELAQLAPEQAAAFKRAHGLDPSKDIPVDRASDVLRAISTQKLLSPRQQAAARSEAQAATPQAGDGTGLSGASGASAQPTPPPGAPGTQAAPPAATPLAQPSPTAPTTTAPSPAPLGGATVRDEYDRLAKAARENPGNPRLRLAARLFAANNERALRATAT